MLHRENPRRNRKTAQEDEDFLGGVRAKALCLLDSPLEDRRLQGCVALSVYLEWCLTKEF